MHSSDQIKSACNRVRVKFWFSFTHFHKLSKDIVTFSAVSG